MGVWREPTETAWRDPNIAFMNELSLVFQALNIDAGERGISLAPFASVLKLERRVSQ
jgi:UDP-N-acetyl-D-mannosaminuronate dehydrogenase